MRYGEYRDQVRVLQSQWNKMWRERIDDEVRAEGVANQDYPELFVEKGTVIIATRDYLPPCFEEILDTQIPKRCGLQRTPPHSSQGGYRKLIRDVIVKQKRYGLDSGRQRKGTR
jgi:hypothetical protein